MADVDISASPLEAEAERERALDRLGARTEALQLTLRTHRSNPWFELWRCDLRETRETWFRLVDPDGQDPTPEGSRAPRGDP
ncbi:hypothetical protein PV416_25120 [Streptomyces ipomoeae]|uniref:hypothetical protein n=1 Tax=Streptomyces ipomoeae TaxID=103232 RepID=UPI0011479EEE|nr:hypothetical protein [Streptomyces ipomoeae]MDX2824283.1 hypothetical protein [Streptomyces ipomoeae]MDX2876959.1 hypothetical protein [Streptomyces ipomoeae]TQE35965.1 hypothetical protein Sipo7851_13375 [Streptomyces ipomoeae]